MSKGESGNANKGDSGGVDSEGETKVCAWCYHTRSVDVFTADPYGWKMYGTTQEAYYLTCPECVYDGVWAVGEDGSPWACGTPEMIAPMIPEEEYDRWTIVADKLTGGVLLGADELIGAIRGTTEVN